MRFFNKRKKKSDVTFPVWLQNMKDGRTFVMFGSFAGLSGERQGQQQQQRH